MTEGTTMTAEREAIVRIAKSLTDLEREWITGWQGPRGAAFNAIAGDLRRKGLLISALDWNLSRLGQAVRDHLKESTHE